MAKKRGNPNLQKGKRLPHQFQPGFDPRRNMDGAPPKLSKLKVLEAAFGGAIEPEFDKRATDRIKLWITEMTLPELREFCKRTDVAAFALAYAKRILRAIKDSDTKALEEIYNRAFGMPTSKVAFTDPEGNKNDGGIMFYLPDNGRGTPDTEQNSVEPQRDKAEQKAEDSE